MVGEIILMQLDTYMHVMIEVAINYIWLNLVWGHKFLLKVIFPKRF